jgi:hypothetical protein
VTTIARLIALALWCLVAGCAHHSTPHRSLPTEDVIFLRNMTRDVVAASCVAPGSNGGGNSPITNSCGFTLITPGKDTYQAFWPRDFSMALGTGFISTNEMANHLHLLCQVQNGAQEIKLANGLHVPPWAIPDHINYDGKAVWFPGTMSSGNDQGNGMCGRLPPLDDNYEFIHIAYVLWRTTGDTNFLRQSVKNVPLTERLQRAFSVPHVNDATGLVETTEEDRGVGFGFCDAEAHTGKLLFASLLRYRAADELARLCRIMNADDTEYRNAKTKIKANVSKTFFDPATGWLRASTGLSKQPDVWGTLYALELGVLDGANGKAAGKTIAAAVNAGTIAYEGGVRHVPTDLDFSKTTAWERSIVPVNTYQNGAYWHTATGWLIKALWNEDRGAAVNVFNEMITHLRDQDFRKGPEHGAPWEDFDKNGTARRNAVYMASVALPYSILKNLPQD